MEEQQSQNSIQQQKTKSSPVIPNNAEKKTRVMGAILLVLIIISLSFFGGWLGSKVHENYNNRTNTESARKVVNGESELISSIAKEVGPSVVSVNVISDSNQRNLFTGDVLTQESAGTGFIISENGYVLTNRHVIPSGASRVSITLSDGTKLDDVDVVGRTNDGDVLDVAFLKIKDTKGKKLTPVVLGDSDSMQVGDMVVAIGNALGQFQNTVTSGILSGYGRSVEASGGDEGTESLQNLFQTDAAINQGNSGGPLVNADGDVIAINTAVAGNAENIGFAIPINDAKGLIKGVIENGKLLRPYIGVRYIQLTPEIADEIGVKQTEGAYISDNNGESAILPNSPASEAGIRPKDIIIKIDNQQVTRNKPLSSIISRYGVGERLTITLIRDGKEKTVQITLKAVKTN